MQHYRSWLFWLSVILFAVCASRIQAQTAPASTEDDLSGQEFHCNTGYILADCQRQVAQLKSVLARYPAQELGHWTWILVRSSDWKPLLRGLRLNESSPAFSALEQRETFLEEALFGGDPLRTAELMQDWQLPLSGLLNLAVTHELGHALCDETDEAIADRLGEKLRRGLQPECRFAQARRIKRTEQVSAHSRAGTVTTAMNKSPGN